MKKSEELRQNAENCTELAKSSVTSPEKKRLERLAEGWTNAAENQEWLDGEKSK